MEPTQFPVERTNRAATPIIFRGTLWSAFCAFVVLNAMPTPSVEAAPVAVAGRHCSRRPERRHPQPATDVGFALALCARIAARRRADLASCGTGSVGAHRQRQCVQKRSDPHREGADFGSKQQFCQDFRRVAFARIAASGQDDEQGDRCECDEPAARFAAAAAVDARRDGFRRQAVYLDGCQASAQRAPRGNGRVAPAAAPGDELRPPAQSN
jgi:hypothetical protein